MKSPEVSSFGIAIKPWVQPGLGMRTTRRLAMMVIGSLFTKNLSDRGEFANKSAEDYRDQIRAYHSRREWAMTFIFLGIFSILATFALHLVFLPVAVFCGYMSSRLFRKAHRSEPTVDAIEVSEAWEPVRREVLRLDLIEMLAKDLNEHPLITKESLLQEAYDSPTLQGALDDQWDIVLTRLSAPVRKHNSSKRRESFKQVYRVARKLGFNRKLLEEYIGEGEGTLV